jgi:hypothetical protein
VRFTAERSAFSADRLSSLQVLHYATAATDDGVGDNPAYESASGPFSHDRHANIVLDRDGAAARERFMIRITQDTELSASSGVRYIAARNVLCIHETGNDEDFESDSLQCQEVQFEFADSSGTLDCQPIRDSDDWLDD